MLSKRTSTRTAQDYYRCSGRKQKKSIYIFNFNVETKRTSPFRPERRLSRTECGAFAPLACLLVQETGKLTLPRTRGDEVVVLGPARYPEGWNGNDEWSRDQASVKGMGTTAGRLVVWLVGW